MDLRERQESWILNALPFQTVSYSRKKKKKQKTTGIHIFLEVKIHFGVGVLWKPIMNTIQ